LTELLFDDGNGQAEFEIGIAEQQCEDLALLLGAQDGLERRGVLSVHARVCLAAADDGGLLLEPMPKARSGARCATYGPSGWHCRWGYRYVTR
jgi:hypothetical protein